MSVQLTDSSVPSVSPVFTFFCSQKKIYGDGR